jgi:hypothetical protein
MVFTLKSIKIFLKYILYEQTVYGSLTLPILEVSKMVNQRVQKLYDLVDNVLHFVEYKRQERQIYQRQMDCRLQRDKEIDQMYERYLEQCLQE